MKKMEISNGESIYGPYLICSKGQYHLGINLKSSNDEKVDFKITANKGEIVLQSLQLKSGENRIDFELERDYKDIEFIIISGYEQVVQLFDIGFVG